MKPSLPIFRLFVGLLSCLLLLIVLVSVSIPTISAFYMAFLNAICLVSLSGQTQPNVEVRLG